ncbi:MAG: hypothetical protein ACLT5W_02435 [Ruminococcus sp.]
MKSYKCKKAFCVDNYDADGFLIENNSTVIEEGNIYELDESGHTMIGGEVHLDAIDNGSWLEITKEHLKEYFDEVEVK